MYRHTFSNIRICRRWKWSMWPKKRGNVLDIERSFEWQNDWVTCGDREVYVCKNTTPFCPLQQSKTCPSQMLHDLHTKCQQVSRNGGKFATKFFNNERVEQVPRTKVNSANIFWVAEWVTRAQWCRKGTNKNLKNECEERFQCGIGSMVVVDQPKLGFGSSNDGVIFSFKFLALS